MGKAVLKSEVSELARMLIGFSLDLRDLFGHWGLNYILKLLFNGLSNLNKQLKCNFNPKGTK